MQAQRRQRRQQTNPSASSKSSRLCRPCEHETCAVHRLVGRSGDPHLLPPSLLGRPALTDCHEPRRSDGLDCWWARQRHGAPRQLPPQPLPLACRWLAAGPSRPGGLPSPPAHFSRLSQRIHPSRHSWRRVSLRQPPQNGAAVVCRKRHALGGSQPPAAAGFHRPCQGTGAWAVCTLRPVHRQAGSSARSNLPVLAFSMRTGVPQHVAVLPPLRKLILAHSKHCD